MLAMLAKRGRHRNTDTKRSRKSALTTHEPKLRDPLTHPAIRLRRSPFFSTIDSQKSEHVLRRGISRATTSPSADGADDGRCGREVSGQKVGRVTRRPPSDELSANLLKRFALRIVIYTIFRLGLGPKFEKR